MADKNISDLAKEMLAKRSQKAAASSKATVPSMKKAVSDTAKTAAKNSPSKSLDAMDSLGSDLPPAPNAKMKAGASVAPEIDPDKALMDEVTKFSAPNKSVNHFAQIERDLPKGGAPWAEVAAPAESSGSRAALKAGLTGAVAPASEIGMEQMGGQAGRSLLERAMPYLGAGAAGLIPAALMEGTLGAEDAGDHDADAMRGAEAAQSAKTTNMLRAQKAPAMEVKETKIIPGRAPRAHAPIQTGEASDTQVTPSRDDQLQAKFNQQLHKNFGPGSGQDANDDLTRLLTETDLRQTNETPGPMMRKGGPKNSPAKRPVEIKTRSVAPEDDSEY